MLHEVYCTQAAKMRNNGGASLMHHPHIKSSRPHHCCQAAFTANAADDYWNNIQHKEHEQLRAHHCSVKRIATMHHYFMHTTEM